jgi:hypothetical protein
MALYELGIVGGVGTSGVAQCELRAAATDPIYVQEIGIFLNAATASTIGIGRPANTPAGGTPVLGQANNQDDAVSVGGVITAGWTTSPTVPTQFLRRFGLPAAIGNGMIFTWPKGLRVKQGTSIVIWNLATNSITSIYFIWEE